MAKKMEYGLLGIRMNRSGEKELSRMGQKTENGPGGMRMERRKLKELSRLEN